MAGLFDRQGRHIQSKSPELRSDEFMRFAMDEYGDSVYRVALGQSGSPTDAEDVYQDVFYRLLKDKTEFADDQHLKAWLLRVAINRCHDFRRSNLSRRQVPLADEHEELNTLDQFRTDLWECIAELPEEQRAVIHLFYIEGYSTKEIAEIVETKPETVRTRLFRARTHLRKSLLPGEGHYGEE